MPSLLNTDNRKLKTISLRSLWQGLLGTLNVQPNRRWCSRELSSLQLNASFGGFAQCKVEYEIKRVSEEKIIIELSSAEAIVLFEFLSRFSDKDNLEIQDQAEARVLWDVCCSLESQIVEPFVPNYVELLNKARDEVRDKE